MREAAGLMVPLRSAERTIRTLRKLKLINETLEFTRTSVSITIPLIHEPVPEELAAIKEQCEDLSAQRDLFQELKQRPHDLKEALQNQLSADTASNLPTSFDVIGDIAIIELPDDLSQYASLIGAGILSLNPRVRLVLKKTSEVSGKFRTRGLGAIAGVGTTETLHYEFSCRYRLDVARVYFNPRLSHERLRVAEQVRAGERVLDMFAGVGPYSILIAKKQPQASVFSIDLNPDAYKYLTENIFLNKTGERVSSMLGDARDLVRTRLHGKTTRVIMNLPGEATGFVDVAVEALGEQGGVVHYYTFASRNVPTESIKEMFRSAVAAKGRKVREYSFCQAIREVSPNRVQVALDAYVQ
jgi:tRNA (guanine37-N1)-methyltransferase